MPADLRITVDGEVIEIDTEQQLADLTGDETLEVEDFLRGWENFDRRSARSVYVLYWLARRSRDPKVTLADVTKEKGILFGDRMELEDVELPPAEAADTAATPSTTPDASEISGVGV